MTARRDARRAGGVPTRSSRRLAAACVLLAGLLSGCTSLIDGAPVRVAGGAPPGAVDPELLDPGNFPTKPSAPLGTAGTPARGALVEGRRLADFIVGPWEIDPALKSSSAGDVAVYGNSKALQLAFSPEIAAAADANRFVTGIGTGRKQDGGARLHNAVLLFPDPASATAAASAMTAAALENTVLGAKKLDPIPGHPDTQALSYELVDPATMQNSPAVRAFTAYGPYVLSQFGQAPGGVPATVGLVTATVDKQRPALDAFRPSDPARLADLPVDPTGLQARTVPVTGPVPNIVGVYGRRGAVLFQNDPLRSAALFGETGMDAFSFGKAAVYQAADSAGAQRIVDDSIAELAPKGTTADGAAHMPASRCLFLEERYYCVAPADRYVVEVNSPQLPEAHQLLAAQYLMLTAN